MRDAFGVILVAVGGFILALPYMALAFLALVLGLSVLDLIFNL